jgi:14-3-3 protein epsilon
MGDKKAENLYMARLSEQTERFEDMVDYMKKYIGLASDLKDDDRNLLSIAYKNTVGSRRTAWRAISALENKEKSKVNLISLSKRILEFKTT